MIRASRTAPSVAGSDASGARRARALELMRGFAARTGLTNAGPPDRYLWTDAFAVCNFLGLGETEPALRLVDQVHNTLGRYQVDDRRRGWLSGLDDEAAAAQPTVGGLRIGKQLPERPPGEPLDEGLEWDRDGQYFHYLTRWMHALDQVARWTGEPRYNLWARDLARTAHDAFTYLPPGAGAGRPRMYWKMSVDLTRPLVFSMGHHDPLDGYVTCLQLQASAARLGAVNTGPALTDEAADFAAMIPPDLATADALGIGGLLTDAWRLGQLALDGEVADRELRDRLIDAALAGLDAFVGGAELGLSASHRLGFRELGLAIGLAAGSRMLAAVGPTRHLERLDRFVGLRAEIEGFWLDPANQRAASWLAHQNINEVMLATSLAPDGLLTWQTPGSR